MRFGQLAGMLGDAAMGAAGVLMEPAHRPRIAEGTGGLTPDEVIGGDEVVIVINAPRDRIGLFTEDERQAIRAEYAHREAAKKARDMAYLRSLEPPNSDLHVARAEAKRQRKAAKRREEFKL